MDPDACWDQIYEITKKLNSEDTFPKDRPELINLLNELSDLCWAMSGWLQNGGYAPSGLVDES